MSERYPAVEVAGLHKTFRVPKQHVHTLKERALHPFRRTEFMELEALREISFEIGAGEFFGIVGRNGSGKSTLLKLLAGIYKADGGSIKVAGRLAPFIELGVGFNPDLTAVDNVVLNAVMMGLGPREARARFDDVIAFAELEAFLDMKLKNYSSGMQVRLAFSVMVQADADVLLIDEVLAVGDAAFQQKCFDAFYRLRDEGKTIVLVTHDMDMVERFSHRAMLLDRGAIDRIGLPGEVARRYLELNFEPMEAAVPTEAPATAARLSAAWLGDEDGHRVDAVPPGEPLVLNVELDVRERIDAPAVMLWLETREGSRVFFTSSRASGPPPDAFEPGEHVHLRVRAESALRSGRYFIGASLARGVPDAEMVFHHPHAGDFTVTGNDDGGLLMLEHEVELERGLERAPR
jgi:ABC-type polysaccharide/polyol phosphate transport system ATPase subunit